MTLTCCAFTCTNRLVPGCDKHLFIPLDVDRRAKRIVAIVHKNWTPKGVQGFVVIILQVVSSESIYFKLLGYYYISNFSFYN